MAHCAKSRGAWGSTVGITNAVFTQVQAAARRKTLLLLWWKMMVVIARLPGRIASWLNNYVHMKCEGVDLLI